ncbi:MAG: nicotinamide-nucleotide amidohydrolase family protein, partial [Candidatus Eisenbacteria bacterium]|nr:nicotinamide-nucleotide amidohydrolase family protein [Candidatus Latescibacterota bacterium]MBD3301838.1 nicotinamide-nucleotide amidohydrolase family protein [Candidatus Eisenbacteria bacterium]
LYALPGVPHEMERMAERFVLPEIGGLLRGPRRRERTLRTFGISEARLAARIEPIVPAGVRVAYLPRLGAVDLEFSATGRADEADRRLAAAAAAALEEIGDAVYAEGETDLAEAVGVRLRERGWTLAVAESLTGGALGARIVSIPGASRTFLGDVVAYDDRAKHALLGVPEAWIREHGAVSGPVAEAMAHGARDRFGADVGISTTGVAGPDGGTEAKPVGLAYLGLAWPGGRIAVRRRGTGGREAVIGRIVNAALDLVRRAASGLDPDPGGG